LSFFFFFFSFQLTLIFFMILLYDNEHSISPEKSIILFKLM
jgi:hypothetical protein